MDKIELWPKEVYDQNLRNLLDGKSEEMSLAKMTEEAFALLSDIGSPDPIEPTADMNPLYFEAAPTKK